jgi:lipopolysaccharide biosynthesis regulator YciM
VDLPDTIALYGLLVVAVAIGFLLGRRDRSKRRRRRSSDPMADYYQGLNLLLSERPELAIDQFVESMAVNEQSLDAHLAMGALLRRRGEIDKSIRIHQNLLAAPVLTKASKEMVEFELARDYHSAGLLDRAENLFVGLSAKKGAVRKDAQALLLEIYEQEREWAKALAVGAQLKDTDQSMRDRLSHFECELASEALEQGDHKLAKNHIDRALAVQPSQARAYALLAELEFGAKRYKRVQRALQRAAELAPDLVEEFVERYQQACDNLGDDEAYERFLRVCIERSAHSSLLRRLINHLRSRGEEPTFDDIWADVSTHHDLHHLKILLEIELGATARGERINGYVQKIISRDAKYRCASCGFKSGHLMWHCPTCRAWGTFATTEGSLEATHPE